MKFLIVVAMVVGFAPQSSYGATDGASQQSVQSPAAAQTSQSSTEAPSVELICKEQVEMGTPFKICVYAQLDSKLTVGFELSNAFKKLRSINNWMSEWQSETDLSRVNQAAGAHPVKVGAELFGLLKFALSISEQTEGAFDPTFNALWGLYNFKAGQEREPTEEELRDRLPLIKWQDVVLDEKSKTAFLKRSGMKLGLGGLGQGYGVDAVATDLKKKFSAGFIDGSGDTYFWGKKPDGSLWVTGVRDPRDKNRVVARLYGTDFAITTCGDDEKFFVLDGRRIHHIVDPKTGRSSTASRQVTVIAKRALDADAYDTASFVLGPTKGRALIEKQGFRAIFVNDSGVVLSRGFRLENTRWGNVHRVDGELQ